MGVFSKRDPCRTRSTSYKQIKQNFPLRYFYGESANAIKIQVWVTLIANLLITLLQKGVSRSWSFSGCCNALNWVNSQEYS